MVGTGYPVFAQSQPLAIGIRAAIVAELGCDEHAAAMRAVQEEVAAALRCGGTYRDAHLEGYRQPTRCPRCAKIISRYSIYSRALRCATPPRCPLTPAHTDRGPNVAAAACLAP